MTRISTLGASQAAMMDLMRAQQSLFDAQQQLTTGKKGSDLKAIGYQAETIAASRGALARSEAYEEAGVRAETRLAAQNVALEQISTAAGDLRSALTAKNGDFLMLQVEEAFRASVNALNTQHLGSYMFAGTRDDTKPLTVDTLSDLAGLANIADAFQNNSRAPTVKVDDSIEVATGRLADAVGTEMMAAFKRIAEFDAGPNGPFTSPMTAAQEAFVAAEIQNVVDAQDQIISVVGMNGVMQAQIETSIQSQKDHRDFLISMISDIEDVDMAKAATRFQTAQNVLDVSAKTFASLTQVSLLPFLR